MSDDNPGSKSDRTAHSVVGREQNTLKAPVSFHGRGLFHGHEARVQVLPADANTGIVFRRVDLTEAPDIPATTKYVAKVPRRTVLASSKAATVETVEHLMAALAGLHVDNCVVEIDAPEVPSYDGSCRDFCDGIVEAGLQPQGSPVVLIHVTDDMECRSADGQQAIRLTHSPAAGTTFTYNLDYGSNSPLKAQTVTAELTPEYFYENISAARTFILESEIVALQGMGFGRHLTAKDIVIIGNNGVVDNDLRWDDEGARHKLLDCVGDLALSGKVLHGHVTATRSGHHLNHEMARELSNMNNTQSAQGTRAA